MSRADSVYKNSPTLERDGESGKMKVGKMPSPAEKESSKVADGTAGMPEVERHATERREMKHRHIKEHMDMHHRHEMEHAGHKGDKKEMHKRHLEELTKAHERHESEHKDMHARHEKEGAGATGAGGQGTINKVTEGEE